MKNRVHLDVVYCWSWEACRNLAVQNVNDQQLDINTVSIDTQETEMSRSIEGSVNIRHCNSVVVNFYKK